ncbi:MAG: glycine--tRNA ligase [Candidatus Aenigmatarchaeota archaeon]
MKDLMDIAKRRGFFWPSFELYGGSSGFYTYGPLGSLLKLNIEAVIRDWFIRKEKCIAVDAPLLTTEDPWVASGHVSNFTDVTAECTVCGEPYRADHLIEEKTKNSAEGLSLAQLGKEIEKNKIKCPKCGGKLGNLYDYNMMFKTYIGPGKNKVTGYLRPETAQTTYMPFRRLYELARRQIPFGVIQFGKSFRNEISPRQAIIRLREFSQAEIQFFVDPKNKHKHASFGEVKDLEISVVTKESDKQKKMTLGDVVKKNHTTEWIANYLGVAVNLFIRMGIDKKKLRLRQHKDNERSFYSTDTWDVEYDSQTFGMIELVGIADRTDYDLKRHMELSKKDLSVEIDSKKVVPHVIEIAFGIDRPVFCVMESSAKMDKERMYFKFPSEIAPYKVAVFPLVRKDKLPEKAKEVYNMLYKEGFLVLYDEGFIGKVYYRQDEAGTPYCITIDYDSLKNQDVTIRSRDDQKQIRVKIKDLPQTLNGFLSGKLDFSKQVKLQ